MDSSGSKNGLSYLHPERISINSHPGKDMSNTPLSVDVVDIAFLSFEKRLIAVSLQGLVNRQGPKIFLDYGVYDDIESRTTNEVFIPEDIWQEKYRDTLGNQDQNNLVYYRSVHDLKETHFTNIEDLLEKYASVCTGLVVWDPNRIDTVNLAVIICSIENLLMVSPEDLEWVSDLTGLKVKNDLRQLEGDRIFLYRWAFKNLFSKCTGGKIACIELGWKRPEFLDYVIQNRIFVYSLATLNSSLLFMIGQKLLMLLVGGPFRLRNLIFNLRLDFVLKRLGLFLMNLGSSETKLASRIQKAVQRKPFPTIFGWHTKRDDEFSFMLHLSANGLRLVPSHLASNFSFHSKLKAPSEFTQKHCQPSQIKLEKDKTYLTFTLSDGDQLVLMNTAQLGNWFREERGKVPFNWEMQPLLVDIAPALLGRYFNTLTESDYLIAGPSGAGYIVPPLLSNLKDYLKESVQVCSRAGIKTMTSYIGDPSDRIIRSHGRVGDFFLGFLGGYLHFGRTPQALAGDVAFISNSWPPLDNIADSAEATLEGVRQILDSPGRSPRFIGVHLFAYRTTITDVYNFVKTLDPDKVKVVKADEFLIAAHTHLSGK